MDQQKSLFDGIEDMPENADKSRYDEMLKQFERYNEAHPEVWSYFVMFTNQLVARGFRNYSSQGVFARIRWETDRVDDDGNSTFKISNNYSAFYARRFMSEYPEYEGFFRTRTQPSKAEPATGLPELGPQDVT